MRAKWNRLGGVAATALVEARQQAHYAVQWVTRVARANLPVMPDDSHSSLGWEHRQRALISHPLPARDGTAYHAGLRLPGLRLFLAADAKVVGECALDGRSDAEAGAWIERMTLACGLTPPRGVVLPYALPAHPVAAGAAYSCPAGRPDFAELALWYDAAAELLTEMRAQHAALVPGPGPVRCWPHHFDIATLLRLAQGAAETAPSVGIGMSPGDDAYAQPYFYVGPWPAPPPQALPRLAPPGRWHIAGFVGAVLTGEAILAMVKRRYGVQRFLDAATTVSCRLVAG